jgi:hypothetical protein
VPTCYFNEEFIDGLVSGLVRMPFTAMIVSDTYGDQSIFDCGRADVVSAEFSDRCDDMRTL